MSIHRFRPTLNLLTSVISLLTIISCSNKPNTRSAPPPYKIQQQIERDFLIIRDSELESYLRSLLFRLIPKYATQLTIEIADNQQPFAHSYQSGLVLVSSSLLQTCNSESELAFVLAHESGHVVLGHHAEATASLDIEELRQREMAADAFGIQALLAAGYSANGALSSIQRLSSVWDFYAGKSESGYPSASERLMGIQSKILDQACLMTGRCLTGGIENTREFARFRLRLGVLLDTR